MKNVLAGLTFAALLLVSPAVAQQILPIGASVTQGSGLIAQATGQSMTSTPTRVAFDTAGYSSGGVVTCDTSSTKGLCTVNTAGRYSITCALSGTMGAAPAIGGAIITAELWKNGADFTNGGVTSLFAQATTVAANGTVMETANNTFSASDTFSCAVSSSGTSSPATSNNQLRNWLAWVYLGP